MYLNWHFIFYCICFQPRPHHSDDVGAPSRWIRGRARQRPPPRSLPARARSSKLFHRPATSTKKTPPLQHTSRKRKKTQINSRLHFGFWLLSPDQKVLFPFEKTSFSELTNLKLRFKTTIDVFFGKMPLKLNFNLKDPLPKYDKTSQVPFLDFLIYWAFEINTWE